VTRGVVAAFARASHSVAQHDQTPARQCPTVAPAPPQGMPLVAVGGLALFWPLGAESLPWADCVLDSAPQQPPIPLPVPMQVAMTSHEQSLAKPLLIPLPERGTLLRWPALLRAMSGEESCPCSSQESPGPVHTRT
jgi:hypothetical protein